MTTNLVDEEFLRLLAAAGTIGVSNGWELASEKLKAELTAIANEALEARAREAEETAADRKINNIHPVENRSPQEKRGRKPKHLALFAPLPTELTRCSPFFPYTPKNKKGKKIVFAEDIVLATHSWGKLTYCGPRLTTSHEDLLIVTLAAVSDINKRKDLVLPDGRPTYSYCGSLRELLVARGNSSPNTNDYEKAFELYKDMAGAVVSINNSKGRLQQFSSLIIGGVRNDENKFCVSVNPWFAAAMVNKRVTWYDVRLRMRIKSSYGKCIYRFISSHRGGWSGQLSLLRKTLNLPLDWSNSEVRERLNPAVNELIRLDILGKCSCLVGVKVVLVKGRALLK